jgi:hypothetical protein
VKTVAPFTVSNESGAWVDEEFETLDLGDPRRDRRAVGHQSPHHGLRASGCTAFFGDQAGDGEFLAARQPHALRAQLLFDFARLLASTSCCLRRFPMNANSTVDLSPLLFGSSVPYRRGGAYCTGERSANVSGAGGAFNRCRQD